MTRRSNAVGNPMLVNLPQQGYEDIGEGGLAFFFIIRQKPFEERRQVCIAGDIFWPLQNCQLRPRTWPHFLRKNHYLIDVAKLVEPIDGGLLIGSTGQSLWSDTKEEYFVPKVSNLTSEGKRLYHALKRLYGEVTIVTLLDT